MSDAFGGHKFISETRV